MPALPLFNIFFQLTDSSLTTTDNSGNLAFKALITDNFVPDERAYVRSYDQQVPHGTAPAGIEFEVLEAGVFNDPDDVHKSRKRTSIVTAQATLTDTELGTAWEELRRFADKWTVTKVNADANTLPAAAFKQVVARKDARNTANWRYDLIVVNAWETRVTEEVDAELGVVVTTTESVVEHGTARPTDTIGKFYSQRQVDLKHDILTEVKIGDGTTAFERSYMDQLKYTYPTLLAAWDGDEGNVPVVQSNGIVIGAFFEEGNKRSTWQIYVPLREAWTEMCYVTVHEKVYTAAQAATLLAAAANVVPFGTTGDLGTDSTKARMFNPRPRDISYNGIMVAFHVPDVLCDADSITFNSDSEDEYYGSVSETATWPASNISATAYIALIGSTVCIADNITPWRGGNYMRRRVYIKVK